MGDISRNEEVVSTCFDQFVKKGLFNITWRDSSKALKLQNVGLYYYFTSKDDTVIACAGEASFLFEGWLIVLALSNIYDPKVLVKNLFTRDDSLTPMMKFLAQVCSASEYRMQYCRRFSGSVNVIRSIQKICQKLWCEVHNVEPCVYISFYMLLDEQSYNVPQLEIVEAKFTDILLSSDDASKRSADMRTSIRILNKDIKIADLERGGEVA